MHSRSFQFPLVYDSDAWAPYSHLPLPPPHLPVLPMACSSVEIALVLAPKDLFLFMPEDVWLVCNIYLQSLILNPFLPWLYDNIPSTYFFGLPLVPLVIPFQYLSRQLLFCPLSLMLDLKGLALKKFGLLFPLWVYVFLKSSLATLRTSLPSICWWIPKLTSLQISHLDVCNKALRGVIW